MTDINQPAPDDTTAPGTETQPGEAAVEPAAWSETSWGTPAVDVTAAVHAQLDALGVRDRQRSAVCTLESGDHFSYRRDRTTGRLAGYVWLDGQ